jgi:tape measure domain-containing protein
MATIQTSIQIRDGLSSAFRSMNTAMQATINSFEHLQQVSGNAVNASSIELARRELARAESAINGVEQEIIQSNQAQQQLNNSIHNGTTAANGLLSKLAAIVGTYLTLQAAKDVISLSDEMTNTTARLNMMNDGLQTTAELQQMIYDSAQRSYGAYSQTADLVAKLGMNAKDAFSSNKETVAFAELLNKQFGIAGTNAAGVSAATLQLTQALGSGVLRGQELNSIFEQAPNIIQTIADYLDVPIGKIREMAADGEITAEIVKRAMFAAADDINSKFANMPLTFEQIWTSFKNEALWAFQDVLASLNDIANSEKFLGFVESLKQSLYVIAQVSLYIVQSLSAIGGFLYDNWSILGPIIMGVAGALLAYGAYMGIVRIATLFATAAQWAWNAALTANPIGLVIAGIVLLIGLIYLLVGVINKFAGTSISATGIVAGTFTMLGAFIYNWIVFVWNNISALVEFFANVWQHPVYSVKRLLGNLANVAIDMATSMIGSFDSAATNLGNMFIDGANMAIKAINWVIGALNQIPGVNIGEIGQIGHMGSVKGVYSGLKSKINNWVGDAPEGYWQAPTMDFKSPLDSFKGGYDWGANLLNGFNLNSTTANSNMNDLLSTISGLQDAVDLGNEDGKDTAGNTKKLADSADMLEEDLKYLRDLAERDVINRFTTAEVKVDMTNHNTVNSDLDLDGIIDQFGEKLEETLDVIAEGV